MLSSYFQYSILHANLFLKIFSFIPTSKPAWKPVLFNVNFSTWNKLVFAFFHMKYFLGLFFGTHLHSNVTAQEFWWYIFLHLYMYYFFWLHIYFFFKKQFACYSTYENRLLQPTYSLGNIPCRFSIFFIGHRHDHHHHYHHQKLKEPNKRRNSTWNLFQFQFVHNL